MPASERLRGGLLVALAAALLAACDGPIVARTPEALYQLATEQIANANYPPALDTLARAAEASPGSEISSRAEVVRLALLAGMARAFQEIAESYRAGQQEAGAAAYAAQMRTTAMDYFSRARGRSIELVEALDRGLADPAASPVRVELALPAATGDASALGQVRRGSWIEIEELQRVEKAQIRQRFGESLAAYASASARGRAGVYLATGRELVEISRIYRPEALGDRRMFRLLHERAANAAARAAELAVKGGDSLTVRESEQLLAHCKDVLSNQ